MDKLVGGQQLDSVVSGARFLATDLIRKGPELRLTIVQVNAIRGSVEGAYGQPAYTLRNSRPRRIIKDTFDTQTG